MTGAGRTCRSSCAPARLKQKTTEIVVEFRRPPHLFFNLPRGRQLEPNFLCLCIQPDEGIHLSFQTKVPGSTSEVQLVTEFGYSDTFQHLPLPVAYVSACCSTLYRRCGAVHA
ncbi:MAG: hypothetical protein U0521_19475 [Anaerolineae bacterium]